MINFALDYLDYSNPDIDPKLLNNRVKHLVCKSLSDLLPIYTTDLTTYAVFKHPKLTTAQIVMIFNSTPYPKINHYTKILIKHKNCPQDMLRLVDSMDSTIAFKPYYFDAEELSKIKTWAWNTLNNIENEVEEKIENKIEEKQNDSNSITNLDLDF